MKTTPIEVLIPDRAKWIAQYEDGTLVAFQYKPKRFSNFWHSIKGHWWFLCRLSKPNPNWRETLRKVE